MARTKITSDAGYVTVVRDDEETDGPQTTTYFVRQDGKLGYVRILDEAGRHPQVCEMLSTRGNTLMATVDTLPDVIRHELQRARAAMKRERSHW